MIKVITFDLDDTLWDVRPALIKAEQAQNDWLRKHYPQALEGIDQAGLNQRKRTLLKQQPELIHHISRFRQTFLEHLLLEAGIPPAEAVEAAMGAFQAFIARRHDVALFEHAEPVLQTLSARYLIGALTNGNAAVDKTPLGRYFNFALKAEDVGAAKPETALFEAALAHAKAEPSALVHIGDSHDHDIVGAHRAGVHSIWLRSGDEPSDIASATIRCLSELPSLIDSLDQ